MSGAAIGEALNYGGETMKTLLTLTLPVFLSLSILVAASTAQANATDTPPITFCPNDQGIHFSVLGDGTLHISIYEGPDLSSRKTPIGVVTIWSNMLLQARQSETNVIVYYDKYFTITSVLAQALEQKKCPVTKIVTH